MQWTRLHEQRVPVSTAKFAYSQVRAQDIYQIPDESTSEQIKYNEDSSSCGIGTLEKLSPHQEPTLLLHNFELKFKDLIARCSTQLSSLVHECIHLLYKLKTCLNHYPHQNHLDSYFLNMHACSTDTKVNLLNMLTVEQQLTDQLKNKNERLRLQGEQLREQLQSVQSECANKKQELDELNVKSCQQAAENRSLIKQIQTITVWSPKMQQSEPEQFSTKSTGQVEDESSTAKPGKKGRLKMKGSIISNHDNDEMYRFLLVQAITIQDYLQTEQT